VATTTKRLLYTIRDGDGGRQKQEMTDENGADGEDTWKQSKQGNTPNIPRSPPKGRGGGGDGDGDGAWLVRDGMDESAEKRSVPC
jgi:hypothetical protein